jgi:DNA-binding transcriptional ArsR family regulator
VLRAEEKDAVIELGPGNLRRLARHDPAARGWQQIRRLLRPLDDASAMLQAPLTPHRRRAMLDAAAVVLLRCAETGRSYWAWTDEEWAGILGQDQHGFRRAAPGWADDAVRPHLAAHAFLLGGFTAFCRLGSFSRLTLRRRIESGQYPPDTRIPTESELMEALEVARTTARRAIAVLREEGLIYTVPQRGSYVTRKP